LVIIKYTRTAEDPVKLQKYVQVREYKKGYERGLFRIFRPDSMNSREDTLVFIQVLYLFGETDRDGVCARTDELKSLLLDNGNLSD
jgi:hypothetical protein